MFKWTGSDLLRDNGLILIGDRQTGKTTNVIDWFLEDPDRRAILTFSEREADRVRHAVWSSQRAAEILQQGGSFTKDSTPVSLRLERSITSVTREHRLRGETRLFVVDNLEQFGFRTRAELLRDPNCAGYTVDPVGFANRIRVDILEDPSRIRQILGW
jgi:hypothetical protein